MSGMCCYKKQIINEIHIKKERCYASLKLGQTSVGNQESSNIKWLFSTGLTHSQQLVIVDENALTGCSSLCIYRDHHSP